MSIILEPQQEKFIEEQVARGRFNIGSGDFSSRPIALEQKYRDDEACTEDVRQKVDKYL
jgi:antitoxin ParD1/3/4